MELIRILEGIRTPFLDNVIGFITQLGEETVVVVVICMIFWCLSKRVTYVLAVAFFLSGITVQCMKICFRIDRPWVIDPTLNPVPSAMEYSTGYSFPSGHTQSAAALFGTFGALAKRKSIKIICFSIPFLVAFSRIYLGVHNLHDVVVSLAVTYVIIFITVRILGGGISEKKRDFRISLFLLLYTVAVIAIAIALFASGRIEEKYLSDCLKAAGAGIGFSVSMYIERVYIKFSVAAKNILWQVIKFALGLAGVLAIQEGVKLLFGTGLIIDAVRYFLMIVWAIALFPLIIKRFFEVPGKPSGCCAKKLDNTLPKL